MSAAELFQLFGGAGAGVVGVSLLIAILFVTGQLATKKQIDDADKRLTDMKEQRDEWKRTYELERARGDANEATGRIVRDVMLGLREASETSKELK